MFTYQDKTWCASQNCRNKCGRKLTPEQLKEIHEKEFLVCYSKFCDDTGELI